MSARLRFPSIKVSQKTRRPPARLSRREYARADWGGESLRLLAVCASVADAAHGFHSLDSLDFLTIRTPDDGVVDAYTSPRI